MRDSKLKLDTELTPSLKSLLNGFTRFTTIYWSLKLVVRTTRRILSIAPPECKTYYSFPYNATCGNRTAIFYSLIRAVNKVISFLVAEFDSHRHSHLSSHSHFKINVKKTTRVCFKRTLFLRTS